MKFRINLKMVESIQYNIKYNFSAEVALLSLLYALPTAKPLCILWNLVLMPVQLAKTAFAMRMTGRLAQRVAHGCGSGFGPKSALRLSC